MSLTIERVQTDKQLRQFIKVAWDVYRDDPDWVPWLYFERLEFFDKKKNPFFEHAEADYFIAFRDGRAVGTIAAILNHRHNQFHNENVAHFGVFEVLNDREAALALLDTAAEWGRQRGAERLQGPMNLSTNDECGTLIEGFHMPPVLLMTYNPPYYVDFLNAAGFEKAMDLLAWKIDLAEVSAPGKIPPKVVRVAQKAQERHNLVVRPVNLKDWDAEVARIKNIYNNAWEKNWGFVPMTDGEIERLAEGLRPILDPRLIFMCEKQDGEPVGFSLSTPNVNEPLGRARPGASVIGSYIGAARMILNKRKADWIRVIALGVVQAYRARGVDALLYYETAKVAYTAGYKWAEASWILETNDMMNRGIELFSGKVYKKYRIYEKRLQSL